MLSFNEIVGAAFDIAQTEALKRRNSELECEHLFWGLLEHPKSVLHENGAQYREIIEKALKAKAVLDKPVSIDSLRPSQALREWLTKANSHATKRGESVIDELSLIATIEGAIKGVKLNEKEIKTETSSEVPGFLLDLNQRAIEGRLDPVIGRESEIHSLMEVLSRRSKNNPILLGSAGVGKTAIVEGLALRIVKGEVPDTLLGKTIYSLDLGQLMAGTKYQGEFEKRIQELLKFMKTKRGEAVLFIDEIHQLVGAGQTQGAMDGANLLKPALARGELHCIGATTQDEYQKYLMKDAALERRFRAIPVNEPSREEAMEIIMGLRDKFESHHGISITEDAIHAAVVLSEQYITDKMLPDKAIDLIDEASAALKLSAEAMPAELSEMQADIRAKKMFAKFETKNPKLQEEISGLEEKFEKAKKVWQEEVESIKKVASLQNKIDRVKFELEKYEREGNFEEASRLKYAVLPDLEKARLELGAGFRLEKQGVAKVVARHTGIPVEKILKTKQDSILGLESFVKTRVFGQEEAVHEICESLVTSYAGLSDPTRPLGSFMLLGPSGVGKTETAKALSDYLFDGERSLIRIDLSEFSEKHSVAKLIGAPAGYVGYDEGGVLTEAVRRSPHSIILFDEVEKAHKDFTDILLQVLDDGRLTDNKGRTVSFRNTVIILTTNCKEPESYFKPEVLGRLDGMLTYKSLGKSVMSQLIDRQLDVLNERLRSHDLHLSLDDEAREFLANSGFDQAYGARPLNAVFNKLVSRPLSKRLVAGELGSGNLVAHKSGQALVIDQAQSH